MGKSEHYNNPASQITSAVRSNDADAWDRHYNVNRGYGVSGLNQLTSSGSLTLAYDGRGNMTSDGSGTFGYSAENLLTSAPGTTLAYDPLMWLYETDGAVATRFQYDGTDLIAEHDASGALQRRDVHGPGVAERLVWYEGAGTASRRWLHADERGSVIAVVGSSGGALAINSYDAWGIPAASNMGGFRYTGQAWIPEIGLYYYKARVYSPTLGRFLSADPIGYGDGMNMYAYVGNDPVNRVDPLGLESCTGSRVPGACEKGSTLASGLTGHATGGYFVEIPGHDYVETDGTQIAVATTYQWVRTSWYMSLPALDLSGLPNLMNSGGEMTERVPQTTQRPPVCPPPTETTLGQVADVAGDFSDATAALSLASLGLAAITSETIVGGITFGGLSAGLGALSALGAGVQATAQYFNGNTRGAFSTGAGVAIGLVVPPAMSKALRYEAGGERFVAGVAGEGYGKMASSIVCSGQ